MEVLPQLLARTTGGVLSVAETAWRTVDVLDRDIRWQGRATTAMVARDLGALMTAALPSDLTVRPVRRTDDDPASGVPLVEAAALAVSANPDDDSVSTDSLAMHLISMPPTVRLFAALDGGGTVRGTSGVGVFGSHAHIVFVNTDPAQRGRGIGRAMTTYALVEALGRGAATAYLDASEEGRRLYDAMGFETAAALMRFTHRM